MIENLTYDEAMELIKKHEGLKANALGAYGDKGGEWTNADVDILYKEGNYRYMYRDGDYQTKYLDAAEEYKTGWRISNIKKIRKTSLSNKMYCGMIIEEDDKFLYVKGE